jgi:glycosyltransferase involved in cell wall biosynthesis/SAM-dependent methyltransferase
MTKADPAHEDLDWTGERYLPRIGGNIELEHLHRYYLTLAFVEGRRVLDIASGEGYGSSILATSALRVVGVDISAEAIEHATRKYGSDTVEFRVGTCSAIPLPAASIDVAVSFETIEHHTEHHEMMRELKRVLVPGGLLVISSPDRLHYSDIPGTHNPYHAKELYREEFEALLNQHFRVHRMMGQRIVYGSAVFPDSGDLRFRHFEQEGETRRTMAGMPRPLYLIAVASDAELPSIEGTVFEQPLMESDTVRVVSAEAARAHALLAERKAELVELQAELAERWTELAAGQAELAELHARVTRQEQERVATAESVKIRVAAMERQRDDARGELQDVLASRSWRLLAPTRAAKTAATGLLDRGGAIFGKTIGEIRRSGLFDGQYYLERSPDVAKAGVDPARHYLLRGWKEGRDPSANFSTARYLADYPDVARARVNPLVHYLRHGRREGRRVPSASLPSSTADAPARLAARQQTVMRVIDQRVIDGEVDAIRRSGRFDADYYTSMYPEIEPAPVDPIRHYCEQGWQEGRNPSDDFDTDYYLSTYSDIRNAEVNPFWHFVVAGASEQRHARPDQASRFEDDVWFGEMEPDVQLIAFHVDPDWAALQGGPPAAGRPAPAMPHPALGFYDHANPDVLRHQTRLLRHHGLHALCFTLDADAALPAALRTVLDHVSLELSFCVQIHLDATTPIDALLDVLPRLFGAEGYVRTDGRPLVVVAGDGTLGTLELARQLRLCLSEHQQGVPYMVMRGASDAAAGAEESPFEAMLDLPTTPVAREIGQFKPIEAEGADTVPYRIVAARGLARVKEAHGARMPVFHAVTLARNDSPRLPARPLVYTRFLFRDYRRWLDAVVASTRELHPKGRRFAFIDGWNDWSRGTVLEPDGRCGFAKLNETSRALLGLPIGLTMPKVSVIVPNFNHEAFLRERLDCIYGQTYPNIEVILLDDCSTDASRDVLERYAADHPQITRTLFNSVNSGGPFRQWARGITAATGDLVWIAESDDFCAPDFLEVLVRAFDDPAVLLAYARCEFVDRNGTPMAGEFEHYVSDLDCAGQWRTRYARPAHLEVAQALGVKNTVPNGSGAVFRRPVELPLLDDPAWLSMRVAGDWVLYLHLIRGGKVAYVPETTNYFRRYPGSAAEVTYSKEVFYREVGSASRTAAALYDVPLSTLERCRQACRKLYVQSVEGGDDAQFERWYDFESIIRARGDRPPAVMVATMGFYPGGAEILPIRLANEFKRQGLSVLMLNVGLTPPEDGVRRMLRNDIPVVETARPEELKSIIADFGIEALNSHQWHVQKYPSVLPDVFDGLCAHVASLHGMIEHGAAFGVTEAQIRQADRGVTTWVYTAEKNIGPFDQIGLFKPASSRFVKLPNGMTPPRLQARSRAEMQLPDDAFVLCCVSRAIPDKGWREMIDVVACARTLTDRDIRIVLVGNGPVYEALLREGVPAFVHLAGFSEDSVGHYAAADMGIMLTRFKSESFPLTIVDCLFAGKPYIASDIGEIRNMLTSGDGFVAGDIVVLEDWQVPIERAARSVAAFASDPGRYEAARRRVPGLSERYHIDIVAAQYVALFKRDCATRRQALREAARP